MYDKTRAFAEIFQSKKVRARQGGNMKMFLIIILVLIFISTFFLKYRIFSDIIQPLCFFLLGIRFAYVLLYTNQSIHTPLIHRYVDTPSTWYTDAIYIILGILSLYFSATQANKMIISTRLWIKEITEEKELTYKEKKKLRKIQILKERKERARKKKQRMGQGWF